MSLQDVTKRYTPTIGIECHVQLATTTKLFSGADNDARDRDPNTTVSPICFGFPGVLPVLNENAITLAIRAGLALQAALPAISRFERKHYFYPDLPLGYQITQLAEPVIVGGHVDASQPDGTQFTVRIHHAHLESDAGKLTHPAGGNESYVDLNRAGTPLIEIVSEPDMHSPAEAKAFTQELYKLMTYAGVTHGDLYHGNMRFDVNISLAPNGDKTLGTRAEIKNLNSFKAVERAAEYECERQAKLLDKGQTVVQETRGWNEDKGSTFSQRSKEDAHDYRYFPDADLPPVRITPEQVSAIAITMPDMPDTYRQNWQPLGLDYTVVNALLLSQTNAQLIESIRSTNESAARRTALWLTSVMDEDGNEVTDISQDYYIQLADMVDQDMISSTAAKILFTDMRLTGTKPRDLAEKKNLLQVSDEGEVLTIVDEVLADPESQQALQDVRDGNEKAIGYLVGQVMKRSAGKANPELAGRLIRSRL